MLLALARPAHHTQVCLRSSHARTMHGEIGTCLAFRQRIMCHTHVVSNEKNFLPQNKTCLSVPLVPRPLNHPHVPAQSAAPVSSLSCHLHARTCLLRKPCLCAQSFIRSSVPTKPSHSTLGQQTTEALPNDDAVTDTTTDGQKRNGRDLTARAERSTLGLKPSHLGKLTLPAHSDKAVISRCPKSRANDSAVQPWNSSQRQAAVENLVFAKTLLQHVLHKLGVELIVCEL